MEDKTIKEICDVVTAEVMKQIQANLAAIKPQIIEEITNNVLSKINANANNSTNSIAANTTNVNSQQQSNQGSPRWGTPNLSDEQRNKILTLCQETNKKYPNKVDNEKILSITRFAYIINGINFLIQNGWIYYIDDSKFNSNGGEYRLFRVRINGTDNTLLTAEPIVRIAYKNQPILDLNYKYAEFYFEGPLLHYTIKGMIPRIIDVGKLSNTVSSTHTSSKKEFAKLFKRK